MTEAAVSNPLVAARQDSTQWYTGLGIVESVNDTIAGIESGSWIDSTIGGVATGLDALATVLDPLGALASWGVAWLLEHVKPLSDALDWLAGDPDQITAYAQTWRNVAGNCTDVAADFQAAVASQIVDWGGDSGQAYRQHAAQHVTGMAAIGRAADGMAVIVEGAGLLVALVRELVRDLIAEFVATLAVRLPLWTAEVGFTLGIASPYVVSQVGSLVAKWAARIAKLVNALISSLRRLAPMLGRLGGIIDEITDLLRRLARFEDGTGRPGSGDGGDGGGTPERTGGEGGDGSGDPDGADGDSPGDADGDGQTISPPPSADYAGVRTVLGDGAELEKHRNSEIYRRPGDGETAAREFDTISAGQDVREYPNGTRAITLEDGTEVTLRKSSDGRTTIEVFTREPRSQTKYRYGDQD